VVSDYVLFSGCAAEHDRVPVRAAALAVAKVLGPALSESGVLACCGARSYTDPVAPAAPHLLAPVSRRAAAGARLVCLSPACAVTLGVHLATLAREAGTGPAPAIVILDYVEYLAQAGDFSARIRRSLAPLQVMVQDTCPPDHGVTGTILAGSQPAAKAGSMPAARAGSATLTAEVASPVVSCATIAGWTGAQVLSDPHLAGAEFPAGGDSLHEGLRAAVSAGAEVLVTPCHLCFSQYNRLQRTLGRDDPARDLPVLHLAQMLGMACNAAPMSIGLTSTAASGKRVLMRYVV
jgi:Fe-S oxidoreductase